MVFRKSNPAAAARFFAAGSAGLTWLAAAGGASVVPVRRVGADFIELEQLGAAQPSAARPARDPRRPVERERTVGRLGVVLLDPAAYGGHRETDLAMLALYGAPFLAEIITGYQEAHPRRPGWAERIPLHQLHPLAVHASWTGNCWPPN